MITLSDSMETLRMDSILGIKTNQKMIPTPKRIGINLLNFNAKNTNAAKAPNQAPRDSVNPKQTRINRTKKNKSDRQHQVHSLPACPPFLSPKHEWGAQ